MSENARLERRIRELESRLEMLEGKLGEFAHRSDLDAYARKTDLAGNGRQPELPPALAELALAGGRGGGGSTGPSGYRWYTPNNWTENIDVNKEITVKGTLKETVESDVTIDHQTKEKVTIGGGGQTVDITGPQTIHVVGKRSVTCDADETKKMIGKFIKTTLAAQMSLEASIKAGVTIGNNTSLFGGTSASVTKGATFSSRSGPSYTTEPEANEKTPTFKEQIGAMKGFYGDVVREARGKILQKAAAKLKQKAADIETLGDNGLSKYSDYKLKADSLKEKGSKKEEKFSQIQAKASLF